MIVARQHDAPTSSLLHSMARHQIDYDCDHAQTQYNTIILHRWVSVTCYKHENELNQGIEQNRGHFDKVDGNPQSFQAGEKTCQTENTRENPVSEYNLDIGNKIFFS